MMRWGRVGALGLGALSVGCHDAGLEELEQRLLAWRADAVAPAVKEVSAAPTLAPESYRFVDSSGPFSTGESEGEGGGMEAGGPSGSTARPPLEQVALEALTLVGTLSASGAAWALVRTPEGTVHRLGVGSRLGRHRGRIVAISGAAVHLVERRPDGNGGWIERDVTLELDD
ncbi:pilus assembly protein PilP [Halomonas elongata]|uniref:Fimbrial assembly protein PilP n=2 Tax=Halomonas elongata TaxID=2746 RepID=E1V8I5_HALED|nr:pilus assembly protein PilP [Halomonas elongata]WBF17383.1 pilus assembly protein PilP [Halomonas elongata]WPU46221.1 pilus assembly protein PilP [Halomonas elongata DSM 2581]CBV43641.1 fimbrial assembly protein PilP [Halomonas elongata DSM 2581]